jgi:dienelactone hydrolase
MKHRHSNFLSSLTLILLFSIGTATAAPDYEYEAVDTFVDSRGVQVPVTWTYPIGADDETFPLVVMAHGHGGSRKEAGSFDRVANGLATRGVATIRMDFPGCGDSTESFANNNLGNMLADIIASRNFAIQKPLVDADRVGLFGWSMGGRLVLMLSDRNDEFNAIATWAPAASPGAGSMIDFLGGPEAFAASKAQAGKEGYVPFTTRWGQDQKLGLKFFTDMEQSRPLEQVQRFDGSLFVLYGDRDDVVLPEVAESVVSTAINSVEVVRYTVKGADHGLGVFSDEPDYTDQAVTQTVDFLANRL